MLKISIGHIIKLPSKIQTCMKIGIRHESRVPSLIMNNGNEMPILGLGTWSSTPDYAVLEKPKEGQKIEKTELSPEELKESQAKVAKAVDIALDAGYRHIDCAHLYNNEKAIGDVINKKIKDKKIKREDIFITSKLWNTFHEPDEVANGCAQTLKDMGLKYLDLYLMHSPMGFQGGCGHFPTNEAGEVLFNPIDYRETWAAMEALVDSGLCKNIGISNFNQEQVDCLLRNCRIRPQALQIELHPYLNQDKLVKYAICNDICITAYAAVGSKRRPWAHNERMLLEDSKVIQLAKKHKRTPAQILLRYQVQMGRAALVKSENKDHIQENIKIFDFELHLDDMANLYSLDHNFRYFHFSGASGHPYHPFE